MTLAKQMTFIMIIALSTLFFCTFIITVHHSKIYFEEQLARNAQDTATALGLSMSKQPSSQLDKTQMLSIISAVFDRGNFSSILIRNTHGQTLVARYLKAGNVEVPHWFATLINIHNEEKSALIMRGWQQVGEVVVRSDKTMAEGALWSTVQKLSFLFLLTTLCILFLSVLFIKARFKPLNKMVQQADDISRKNFYSLDIPKPKELRKLSTTMNAMVAKLKEFFTIQVEEIERLRAQAYQDSLTGKGNRRYFFQHFNEYLSNENYFLPGFLFLIELSGMTEFNQAHGYQEGDQVIVELSGYLSSLFPHHHIHLMARLDGPSFAVVILEENREVIELLLSDIAGKLQQFAKNKNELLSCYVGVVRCGFTEVSTDLLAKADKIIKTKQSKDRVTFGLDADDKSIELLDSEAWGAIIGVAIKKKTFHFYSQPVKSPQGIYHKECFIKLLNDSIEINARVFFPIVEKYLLGSDIDKLVLETIITIQDESSLAINLSGSTVSNETQREEFLSLVKKSTRSTKKIIHFEFSEFILAENTEAAALFVNELVKLGQVIGIDRVGGTLTPLSYLKDLNLAYLKLDGSLSAEIENNKLKQEIIVQWITTAKRLDIILIATAVENESQWRTLKQLGIQYFQGNYIQSPYIIKI